MKPLKKFLLRCCYALPWLGNRLRLASLVCLPGGLGGQVKHMAMTNGMTKVIIKASLLAWQNDGKALLWVIAEPWILLARAGDLKACLADRFQSGQVTRRQSFDFFEKLFASGLITSLYEDWLPRRQIAYEPVMSKHERLQQYLPISRNVVQRYLQYQLSAQAQRDTVLSDLLERFVLTNLIATFFGVTNLDCCDEIVKRILPVLKRHLRLVFQFRNIAKLRMPRLLSRFIYWGEETNAHKMRQAMQLEFLAALGDLHDELFNKSGAFVQCLQSYLLQRDGHLPSEQDLLGEIIGIFFAGWDSTVTSLYWLICTIECEPDRADKLHTACQSQSDPLHCEYLDRSIKETLRLFPPFPIMTRGVETPFEYDGVDLKLHDVLIFLLLAVQRDPKVWGDDADQFKPERFDAAILSNDQRKAYRPFGAGIQTCIAKNFALQIMKLFTHQLYRHYQVALSLPGYSQQPVLTIAFADLHKIAVLDKGGTLKPFHYDDMRVKLVPLQS